MRSVLRQDFDNEQATPEPPPAEEPRVPASARPAWLVLKTFLGANVHVVNKDFLPCDPVCSFRFRPCLPAAPDRLSKQTMPRFLSFILVLLACRMA